MLTAVAAGAPHSSVDAVASAVRDRLGDGSAQTVYNVLRALADAGLVRRIEPAGRPGLYELRVGDKPVLYPGHTPVEETPLAAEAQWVSSDEAHVRSVTEALRIH